MAMTWASLTSPKGTAGSIANWVSYTKLDINTIVDEAQALLYTMLRVREMRTQGVFLLQTGFSEVALPARFLDPIGRLEGVDFNLRIAHKDETFVQRARTYTNSTGSLGTNPFTTTLGATTVAVNLPGHGFSQGGTFAIYGATLVNGITLSPLSFPIVSITDPNNFVIDTVSQVASASGTGGGAAVTYTANTLTQGVVQFFAIWDEKLKFDFAMNQDVTLIQNYFQSLPLLSTSNQSNFITTRYPNAMRTASQAAAADFMKDDQEYQKATTRLEALVQRINIENDGFLRGLELDTENP